MPHRLPVPVSPSKDRSLSLHWLLLTQSIARAASGLSRCVEAKTGNTLEMLDIARDKYTIVMHRGRRNQGIRLRDETATRSGWFVISRLFIGFAMGYILIHTHAPRVRLVASV